MYVYTFNTLDYLDFLILRNKLSQRYNAAVLYFDNISELANITRPLFIQNKTSISEASLCTMILILSFKVFKQKNILWRYRVWKQMKCILIYQFPTCYPYSVLHKIRTYISVGKFWIRRRFIFNQMSFFQLVFVESAFSQQTRICNSIAF